MSPSMKLREGRILPVALRGNRSYYRNDPCERGLLNPGTSIWVTYWLLPTALAMVVVMGIALFSIFGCREHKT